MIRRWTRLGALFTFFALAGRAEETSLNRYATVTVEPVATSIYIGNVKLTMPVFMRAGITYESTYEAKVFPYFFYDESGKLWIDFPDQDLQRLQHGETVNFTGHALSSDNEERKVEGRAVPTDALTGKLKVRVFVSKKIELIFNTTYRFTGK